mgnify:FL=1
MRTGCVATRAEQRRPSLQVRGFLAEEAGKGPTRTAKKFVGIDNDNRQSVVRPNESLVACLPLHKTLLP